MNETSLNIYGNIRDFSTDDGLTSEENVPNDNTKRFLGFLNQFFVSLLSFERLSTIQNVKCTTLSN